jgi:hypothetical protein
LRELGGKESCHSPVRVSSGQAGQEKSKPMRQGEKIKGRVARGD